MPSTHSAHILTDGDKSARLRLLGAGANPYLVQRCRLSVFENANHVPHMLLGLRPPLTEHDQFAK